MRSTAIKLLTLISVSLLATGVWAQAIATSADQKPYKILTSGKQITIKSAKGIKQVMLWTTGGNRVVE